MELATAAKAPRPNFDPPTPQVEPLTIEQKAAMFDQWLSIAEATDYTPGQRIQLMLMYADAQPIAETPFRVLESTSAQKIANRVGKGCKKRVAGENLQLFEDAGLIQRELYSAVVNKYGEEIPQSAIKQVKGAHWWSDSTAALPPLPATLPTLGRGANTTRSCKAAEQTREENAATRKALAAAENHIKKLQKTIAKIACPECGVVGSLHVHVGATCNECAEIFSQQELRKIIDKQAPRQKARKPTRRCNRTPSFGTIAKFAMEQNEPVAKFAMTHPVAESASFLGITYSVDSAMSSARTTEGGASQCVDPQEFAEQFLGNMQKWAEAGQKVNRG